MPVMHGRDKGRMNQLLYMDSTQLLLYWSFVIWELIDSGFSGRGTARAEDAQGTPTHISPSILVYEDIWELYNTCCAWT